MSSPPRDTRLPLFDAETLWRATAQGILVLMSTLASYAASVCSGLTHGSADEMRSMVMVTFVVANGVLIFASKSRQSRPWPSWFQGRTKSMVHSSGLHSCTFLKPRNVSATVIALGTVALVLMTMYWPWAGKYLRFEPLSASALGLAFACGCLGWVVNAVMKR